MKEISFDYFRGLGAEQYSFFRVPKVLFTEDRFKDLSCEAKVLYGLMLDRMGLSLKNHWIDEEERVYIIFTVEEIMELMGCRTQKATKLLKELDARTGIGLIERRRPGLGRPNVIYVKDFMLREMVDRPVSENMRTDRGTGSAQDPAVPYLDILEVGDLRVQGADMQDPGDQRAGILRIDGPGPRRLKVQDLEDQRSAILKMEDQGSRKSKMQSFENQNSGISKIKDQDFRKSKTNKTESNKTDSNDTDPIHLSIHPPGEIDGMEEMEGYRGTIRKNIAYECFADRYHRRDTVDELVELMTDVMALPDDSTVRIAGVERPVTVVKSQFMKLGQMHIEYVLDCLQKNTSKVENIRGYLLTTLYNAPMTIENYYHAEVVHDLHASRG